MNQLAATTSALPASMLQQYRSYVSQHLDRYRHFSAISLRNSLKAVELPGHCSPTPAPCHYHVELDSAIVMHPALE